MSVSSRKFEESEDIAFKAKSVGGVTFAKESSEFGKEIHHYSFLNSSY